MSRFASLRYWFAFGQYDSWRGVHDLPPVTCGTLGAAAYERGQRAFNAGRRYPRSFRVVSS